MPLAPFGDLWQNALQTNNNAHPPEEPPADADMPSVSEIDDMVVDEAEQPAEEEVTKIF